MKDALIWSNGKELEVDQEYAERYKQWLSEKNGTDGFFVAKQRSLSFHVPFDSVLYLEEGESLRSLGVRGG